MNIEDNRTSLISALLDDMDLKDIRANGSKDPQKIILLQDEILKLFKRPNFTAAVCQAFDNSNRLFTEDYIDMFCQLLRLSPVQSLAIAHALTQSQKDILVLDAQLFMKKILPLAYGNPMMELTEDTLSALVTYILHNKELSSPDISGRFLSSLRSHQLQQQQQQPVPNKLNQESLSRSLLDRPLSIANLLLERGPTCSLSKEIFRQTLKDSGILLSEDQLAGIIVALTTRYYQSTTESGLDDNPKWNLDIVADVLNVEAKGFNWTSVVHFLDQPNLVIRSEAFCVFIVRVFCRISGMALPAAGLIGTWVNKPAQLAFLVVGATLHRSLVDFSAMVSADQQLPGDVPTPNNYSWLCLPLYTTFLQLANSGLSHEVLEALSIAASTYPEYVTVSLAQVHDQATPNSGVRAEILRRTLPQFSGLPGSRQTSMAVMIKLSSVNPDLLVLLFRIALKRAQKLKDIIEIDMRVKTFGLVVSKRLEDEAGIDENLGYWCVKADRSDFNLEARVSSVIEMNPQLHCRAILGFLKAHVETLRPRIADGGLLSFENFSLLLRILQSFPAIIPIDELRSLAAIASQQQHSLQHGIVSSQTSLSSSSALGMMGAASSSVLPPIPGIPPASGGLGQGMSGVMPLSGDQTLISHGLGDRVTGSESDDIDEEANAYFQKIYTSDISIPDIIILLKRFKASTEKREQEIFRCMIHNLFDEYRFFHKYPDKELHLTGSLFGALIQNQLVSSITLGIALRYVLEAIRKDPEEAGSNEKMFRFGKIALEQFRSRLVEWPQYCSHVIQIPHLQRHCPELFQEAQRALNNPPGTNTGNNTHGSPSPTTELGKQLSAMNGSESISSRVSDDGSSVTGPSYGKDKADDDSPTSEGGDDLPFQSGNAPYMAPPPQVTSAPPTTVIQPQPQPAVFVTAASEAPIVLKHNVIERMALVNVELMNTIVPPEGTRDKMHMIVNNIDKANVESKSNELKAHVIPDYYNWFANYLVVRRISAQPNLHPLYLTLIDTIDNPDLNSVILDSTYHNATKLLLSPKITTSSTERTLLRNLGIWLGLMTLARNRPLLHRRMEVKELLFWGYETGRLIAVCSFVARILEGVKESKVFRPPNPWLLGVLGVLRELYEIEDLKMNIKFEVQVLCKNINIKMEDIPKTSTLINCKVPIKDSRNPDFNVKNASALPVTNTPPSSTLASSASPQVGNFGSPTIAPMSLPRQAEEENVPQVSANSVSMQPGVPLAANIPTQVISNQPPQVISAPVQVPQQPGQHLPPQSNVTGVAPATPSGPQPQPGNQEQTVIPNLSTFISINPSLQFFTSNPAQRRLVSIAVDRAIRELIQPVAERSVTIASVTTKQLITKDFATEANEQLLRRHAHLMIASLAGSMALVTCKEPLRLSICNHLRSLLSQATSDQALIEQIVQVCSNDNLEIGCKLIEKAATEKAVRDCDESLSAAYQLRRKTREQSSSIPNPSPFVDPTVPKGAKYPKELPDNLKPRLGGLLPQQLQLYEGFQRVRMAAVTTPSTQTTTGSPNSSIPSGPTPADVKALPVNASTVPVQATLNMVQALEGYQMILSRIEASLRNIQMQAPGREINYTMLGPENEIQSYILDIVNITNRIQPVVRNEASLTFAETVLKRLFENLGSNDTLKTEVFVTVLDSLREVSGGPKKLSIEMINWINSYSTFNMADGNVPKMLRIVLILLLRAKLIRTQDIDYYFSLYMDSGNNMLWVEFALGFIKQCLADNVALTYEFPLTFDVVSKIRPHPNVRKHLQKYLTDIHTLANAKDEKGANYPGASSTLQSGSQAPIGTMSNTAATQIASSIPVPVDPALREQVTVLLDKWLRISSSINDVLFTQYLQLMHQYGIFKTEEAADKFFKIAIELCVEASLKAISTPGNVIAAAALSGNQVIENGLNYSVLDGLSKLFVLLMRLAEKEPSDISVRVNLLSRILNAISRSLLEDHESKQAIVESIKDVNAIANNQVFDQRPYYRLLSNLALDFNIPDAKKEANPNTLPIMATFAQVYSLLHPGVVPGFAFAWLQLISQRTFLPHLMLAKGQKGWQYVHKLILMMLTYLYPHLSNTQLNEPIRKLYKGTLRVLLMLLHDFPEFLLEYQLTLCDAIPLNCIQLRNLVLSAIPRTIRLPDPFTPNLKVDLIPEITQPPRLLPEYFAVLNERGIRPRIDTFYQSRLPSDLPSILPKIVMQASVNSSGPSLVGESGLLGVNNIANSVNINIPLLNSIIVYVGATGAIQFQNKVSLSNIAAIEIFKGFLTAFDSKGRNIVLNCMINQLRYPNSHTHFFSYVILLLFMDAESNNDVFLQEQIARVLLERLIVHKPHPWGLLITFIELIKNARYGFLKKSFTRSSPEIERLFESVARSCLNSSSNPSSVAPASPANPNQTGTALSGSQQPNGGTTTNAAMTSPGQYSSNGSLSLPAL